MLLLKTKQPCTNEHKNTKITFKTSIEHFAKQNSMGKQLHTSMQITVGGKS